MSTVATTVRLWLREAREGDAPFVHQLLNEPGWQRYIGGRQVRSPDDARDYIRDRLIASYRERGYGLWVMGRVWSDEPIGLCGLQRRDWLQAPDLGFAVLEAHWGQGYAQEASRAVLDLAFGRLCLPHLEAITRPDNARSIRVLEGLGFGVAGRIRHPQTGEALSLYSIDRPAPEA